MILAHKGHIHRKEGIGFVSNYTQQKLTTFIKEPTLHVTPRVNYNFCVRCGHFGFKYSFKKYDSHKLV